MRCSIRRPSCRDVEERGLELAPVRIARSTRRGSRAVGPDELCITRCSGVGARPVAALREQGIELAGRPRGRGELVREPRALAETSSLLASIATPSLNQRARGGAPTRAPPGRADLVLQDFLHVVYG